MVRKKTQETLPRPDRLYTILEVADVLHMSRSYIYLLVASGQLRTVRIGRSLRIRPEDVQAYIHAAQLRAGRKHRKGGPP
jgi:excisionase family DNA binding protein